MQTSLTDRQLTLTEVRRTPVTVPESKVTMSIPVDSVLTLPTGASYSQKSGQARVNIQRGTVAGEQGEVIVVEATCDSLQLVCEEYMRTIQSLKKELAAEQHDSSEQIVKRGSDGVRTAIEVIGLIVIIPFLLFNYIKTKT